MYLPTSILSVSTILADGFLIIRQRNIRMYLLLRLSRLFFFNYCLVDIFLYFVDDIYSGIFIINRRQT